MTTFKAKALPAILFLFSTFANVSIYVLARYLGQTDPWPALTITETSNNYPGYIIFRGLMIYCCPIF